MPGRRHILADRDGKTDFDWIANLPVKDADRVVVLQGGHVITSLPGATPMKPWISGMLLFRMRDHDFYVSTRKQSFEHTVQRRAADRITNWKGFENRQPVRENKLLDVPAKALRQESVWDLILHFLLLP